MINVLSYLVITFLFLIAIATIVASAVQSSTKDDNMTCKDGSAGGYVDMIDENIGDRNIEIAMWQKASNGEEKNCQNSYEIDKSIKGKDDCNKAYVIKNVIDQTEKESQEPSFVRLIRPSNNFKFEVFCEEDEPKSGR